MKTKFAIGCLVQWYECDIIEEYVDSLKDAVEAYDGQVIIDFTIVGNQGLEKCISEEQMNQCIEKIDRVLNSSLLLKATQTQQGNFDQKTFYFFLYRTCSERVPNWAISQLCLPTSLPLLVLRE